MRNEPVLVVMKPTQVKLRDGRTIILTPGLKSHDVMERIKSALPLEKVKELKAKSRVVEDVTPW